MNRGSSIFSLLPIPLAAVLFIVVSSPTVNAAEISITIESPVYTPAEVEELGKQGYTATDYSNSDQWSDGAGAQAVIFDSGGTSEPIRNRNDHFKETGATIEKSAPSIRDIYVVDLFNSTKSFNILKATTISPSITQIGNP